MQQSSDRWHRRYPVTCDLIAQTACDHIASGSDFLRVCEKRADGCPTDLVGVSDYRACCLSGRICIFKENHQRESVK